MKINIAKKFPKNFLRIINAVGRSADRDKISAYIVGGPVRDALLSVKNHDLDFVVEGDAIRFAGCLNSGLRGSLNILDKVKQILHVEENDTTEDLRFTLEPVACLGACGLAPVVMIDDETHGRLTPDKVQAILDKYE